MSQAIVRRREPQAVFDEACRIAVELAGYRMAWLGLEDGPTGEVRVAAHAGVVDGYLEQPRVLLRVQPGVAPTTALEREGRHQVVDDIAHDPRTAAWRKDTERLGYGSCAAFPLSVSGNPVGTINVYAADVGFFDDAEVDLLGDLATEIGLAMEMLEREAEHRRAVDALQQSETKFFTVFDSSPDSIVVIDFEDRKIVNVNRSFSRITGFSREEAVGRTLRELGLWGDAETQDRFLSLLRRDGTVAGFEAPVRTRSGEIRHGVLRAELVTLHGKPHLIGSVRDVTEQRNTRARLQESEQRFRRALENIPDVVVIYDPDLRIQYINEATLRITGRPASDFIGRRDDEIFPPEVYQAYLPALREAFETRQTRSVEATLTLPGAGERSLHIRCIPLVDEHGGVREVLGITHDLTEHVRAEAALQRAQDRLQRAVSASNVCLWEWDLRSNEVYSSPEWKVQIGYADDEIADDPVGEWRSRLHPEDRDRILDSVRAYLAAPGPRYEDEFRLRAKDGSYRHILAHGSVLRDEQGEPVRMLGSTVDVTERTELQARFLQAQKMESVGMLAGGIAHDFNNLLTVINATADLAMMEVGKGEPLRADLEGIRSAGERAAALTRQLLAFSRKQVLQPIVLDLNAVIGGMQSMLQRLIGENVELAFLPGKDLACVRADPGQIEQVLLNLAVNAQDAMLAGGALTIATGNVDETAAREHPALAPGSYVMFSIEDTGVGMDGATQARAFEPFFTTKGPGRGTGLGLSTVQGIVEQSGGSILGHSEVGKGTRFEIYLPRVEEPREVHRPGRPGVHAGGAETILVVEDETPLRDLARRVLESVGYRVLTAASGGDALRVLDGHDGRVHLMFTDVVMPGMSGRDLAEQLAATRPDMKVLYSSGYTDDAILRHRALDDPVLFIGKPYSVADLIRKVREVLDRQE